MKMVQNAQLNNRIEDGLTGNQLTPELTNTPMHVTLCSVMFCYVMWTFRARAGLVAPWGYVNAHGVGLQWALQNKLKSWTEYKYNITECKYTITDNKEISPGHFPLSHTPFGGAGIERNLFWVYGYVTVLTRTLLDCT